MSDYISPIDTTKFQYIPNYMAYGNTDLDKIDMISPSYYDSGSIFGGAMPYGGMMPYGMPYGPFGMNNNKYFDYMKDYQKNWTDYTVEMQKNQRNASSRINAPMESVREAAILLKDKIQHNEQDQIFGAYNHYLDAIKNAYGEASEEELNSRALTEFQKMNGNKSLISELRENGHNSFVQGFIQSITGGLYGKNSAEDNIAKIYKQEVPVGEKIEQNVGRAAGIATVSAATYAAVRGLSGHGGQILGFATKLLKGKAGIIGAVAAGLVAFMTLSNSKVTA